MMEMQRNEIHLWFVYDPQITDEKLLDSYQALMSAEEKKRHGRFVFPKHRHQFLLTRALARSVLAQYIPDGKAKNLSFTRNAFGKPGLGSYESSAPVAFNLSHTEGLIVLAVSAGNEIGVDVEYHSRKVDILNLAERYFSEQEVKDLQALPVDQLNERFLDLWTLKESYIKACGMGLAIPLKDFGFKFDATKISIDFASARNDTPENWGFWQLQVGEGYNLALALADENGCAEHKIVCRSCIPLQSFEEVPAKISRSTWGGKKAGC